MIDFFAETFVEYIWLAVLIIAMIPGLEGRIAIPFGLSFMMQGSNITIITTFFCGLIGTIIPCFIIIPLIKLINNKKNIMIKNDYLNKVDLIINQKTTIKKMFLLSFFVAIPLPLTGVWTGSLIASFTNLKIWQCLVSVMLGGLISSLFILIISILFGNHIIYFLILSIILLFIFYLFKYVFKKNKSLK